MNIKQIKTIKLSLKVYLGLVFLISLLFVTSIVLAEQEETPTVLKDYMGGQSCPSFVAADINNITTKDECTGLVWARKELPTYYEEFAYFDTNNLDPGYSWEQAKKACEEIAKINGQSIFRLPTVEELLSLLQYKCDVNGCSAQIHEDYGLPFFSGGRYWTINDFNEPAEWLVENSRRDYKRSVSLRNGEVDSPIYNIDMRLNAWCVVDRDPEIVERKFISENETVIDHGKIITSGDLKTVYNRKCLADADCDPPLTGSTCDTDLGFCSKIDINVPVHIYNPITSSTNHVNGSPQQIIICDTGYHVEGIACAPNTDPEIGYWEGTETGGDYVWLPFLCPQGTITLEDGSCEAEWSWVSANGIVFDNNTNTNSANETNGEILKVGYVMPTPYIWIANSNINKVSKIRTFGGYKVTRAGIDRNVWESTGQLIAVKDVGANPSRTAVNVETGDVWIANRDSANVTKLDIDGNFIKTCTTGDTPRGLAIEENGDVWVANSLDDNVVKVNGDDDKDHCIIPGTTVYVSNSGTDEGGAALPYGLAMDSQNNVWVANRNSDKVKKIETHPASGPPSVLVTYSTPAAQGLYGITVDLNDDVWVADYDGGVYKITTSTGNVTRHNIYAVGSLARTRGVTIDLSGAIWVSIFGTNEVVKIPDPQNAPGTLAGPYSTYTYGGINPLGICGDSMGQVWAVNYTSANATVFGSIGANDVDVYAVSSYSGVNPYTYSDMTGINRALILRSGVWFASYDKVRPTNIWGNVIWQEVVPPSTSINVYVEVSNSDTPTGNWAVDAATWNAYPAESSNRQGRFLHIKTVLRSKERGVTPVLWDFIILP